jgi:hypothetical protein
MATVLFQKLGGGEGLRGGAGGGGWMITTHFQSNERSEFKMIKTMLES